MLESRLDRIEDAPLIVSAQEPQILQSFRRELKPKHLFHQAWNNA